MMNVIELRKYVCSFCGKMATEVEHMAIESRDRWDKAICSECVELCVEEFAKHKRGKK